MENSAQIFNLLSDLPGGIDDVQLLLEVLVYIITRFITLIKDGFPLSEIICEFATKNSPSGN